MQFFYASSRTRFCRKILMIIFLLFLGFSSNSQTIIISEVADPGDVYQARFVEIYNATNNTVDLTGWQIRRYANANTTSQDITLSGTIASGATITIAYSASDFNTNYGSFPDFSNGSVITGNGDDTYELFDGTSVVDIYGEVGTDGTGEAWEYEDSHAVRNISVCSGNTIWTSSEWTITSADVADMTPGVHSCSCPVVATTTVTTSVVAGSPFCVTASSGVAVNVPFTSTGTFNGGNIYTAQLSNASGSFATPTDIGSLSSTANAGTINATIPAGTAGGTAYRIRVVASDPSTTGSDNGSDLTIVLSPQDVSGAGAISGNTTVDVVWTNPAACYDEIIVVAKAGSITVNPTGDGSAYTANANFGAGTNLGSANYCVYKGTGNNITVTGLTNGMNYCFKIFTRTGTSWSSGVEVCAIPATTTVLSPGDIAVLGLNSNITACVGGSSGDDEISFVCFQDITTGSAFEMTDNGWERVNTGQWGNTEGVIQAVRTGGTIPAGTVITFRFSGATGGIYTAVSPDANWNIAEIHTVGSDLIMNSGGDQIFFMQGGTWNYGTLGSHNAVLTNPNILFGFNTNDVWNADGSTQHSNPFPGLDCYSMMPGVATDYIKYTGAIDGFSAASQREWIRRINNPANWTSYADCFGYYAAAPAYETGYSITINPGGFTDGLWLGTTDTDWFNCSNWESMRVPDQQINVVIPAAGVTHEPTIGDPSGTNFTHAECNDIDLQNGRVLTLNHANSRLDLYGDITFNGNLSHTNGIIRVLDDASTYDASSVISFYSLELNKNLATHSFSINEDIIVNNTLYLNSGKFTTNTKTLIVNNTNPAAIVGGSQNAYVYGNLRRYVNATGVYDFPVGSASYWEHAKLSLNSSSGLTYVDAFFTTPHSTPINISALGLTIGGTLLEELLDYGFWTINPNAYTTVDYDIEISSFGHTNAGATAAEHAVVKRPNALTDWVSQGVHNNATQTMGGGYVTAVRSSLSVFSDFAIAKANAGPLPIDLLHFSATPKEGNVILDWTTASEINNDYFSIERSTDAIHFNEIARVNGAANSNQLISYQSVDEKPLKGLSYYRLRQTDFDGTTSHSNIETVMMDNMPAFDVSQPYCRESNLIFTVFNAPADFRVDILDISGRLIYTEVYSIEEKQLRIPVRFSQGLYILRLSSQDKFKIKRFVL
jgi:hypothetical protein